MKKTDPINNIVSNQTEQCMIKTTTLWNGLNIS